MNFIKVSARLQMRVALVAVVALGLWLLTVAIVVGSQLAQAARPTPVATIAIAKVDSAAARLEKRQRALDALVQRYFGEDAEPVEPLALGAATPFAEIEQQQLAFAETLSEAADQRAARAEAAIRRLGLNPKTLGRAPAMGGPLIPLGGSDETLDKLAAALIRLDRVERALLAIPSSQPTSPMTLSSSFGVRSDPMTGAAALHAGLDITGAHGQAIRAAAPGRVSHVGPAGAYGRLVTIDHGNGLETRYGHLSGFAVRAGERVERGQKIARMGNTGRSTGTHLHFEVRVNDRAVNPRKFLSNDAEIGAVREGVERRLR